MNKRQVLFLRNLRLYENIKLKYKQLLGSSITFLKNGVCNLFSSLLGMLQGPCAAETEPALLIGSKQFGLSRNSHIAIAFDDTKVKNRYVLFRVIR